MNLDWREGESVTGLLRSVEHLLGARRTRLLAVAFCDRVAHLLPDDEARGWLEVARRYAEKQARRADLSAVHELVDRAYDRGWRRAKTLRDQAPVWALRALRFATEPFIRYYVSTVACNAAEAVNDFVHADDADPAPYLENQVEHPAECAAQLGIIRDVLGRPDALPDAGLSAWLAWQDGLVAKMARAIYEDRTFDPMPVLGDALEEAGCDAEALLAHLRSPGPHVRGCWAVDLILGKG